MKVFRFSPTTAVGFVLQRQFLVVNVTAGEEWLLSAYLDAFFHPLTVDIRQRRSLVVICSRSISTVSGSRCTVGGQFPLSGRVRSHHRTTYLLPRRQPFSFSTWTGRCCVCWKWKRGCVSGIDHWSSFSNIQCSYSETQTRSDIVDSCPLKLVKLWPFTSRSCKKSRNKMRRN